MPAGKNNASNLLRKVTSQLRGERIPVQTKEEDELAIYLQGLSQKTQQAKNVGYEEHGDISISSGVDATPTPTGQRSMSPAGPAVQLSSVGSKFLKKKRTDKDVLVKDVENNKDENIVIPGKNKQNVGKSALEKASVLIKNPTSKPLGAAQLKKHRYVDSESDDSAKEHGNGQRNGSAETSVGQDGRHFLKGRKAVVSDENSTVSRSPSPLLRHQNRSLEKTDSPKRGSKSKGEIIRTLGNVYLTSEEESLAEFIHGLSSSETSKKPQNLVAKKQQKWRKKSPSPVGKRSASPIQMSRSPSPFKNGSPSPCGGRLSRSQSQDSDMLDSMASEMLDGPHRDDSLSSEDTKFSVNLMDVASLLPASPSPELGKKKSRKKSRPTASAAKKPSISSPSPFQTSVPNVFKADRLSGSLMSSNKKSQKVKKSSSKTKTSILESLGIQMADDLYDMDLKDEGKDAPSATEESEIVTEKSQDRMKRVESDSEEIETEIGSKPTKAAFERPTSSEEDSISERLNERSPRSKIKFAFSSEEDSSVKTEADYSESFISESETVTQSVDSKHNQRRRSSRKHSIGNSTKKNPKRREHKVVMEEKRIDISTADNEGKAHFWNATQTGVTVSGPFGLQYVDPAPIATHVVSADALEALTAYSPNMLALQDMMRSQLQLVTSFMEIQGRIYSSCLQGLKEDYEYTTLEDTKQYIQKRRKPRLSIDEALRLVDLEEGAAR